ncbi:thioredoxin [Halorubrum californiense DSM 19288]|uniref:Thioredoxin n=1 Tax=Halorubrum californiense DSM 19288 TaxID=1227465 RepID=M0EAB0_9EURY|nr:MULTISPECIES: thioredoxin [Halorubrum]ELZ43822.1 thioredoxin [Halorubrum californiense DSM 19288]TKX72768.1 thioredoxin [Halorubrum sp. GN11GM_10-3_MGM]
MSDAAEPDEPTGDDAETERERIRERKRRELEARLGDGDAPERAAGTDTVDDDGATTPSEPIHVNGPDDLRRAVDDHDVVLVDCYADWCGPCQMMEPAIEALAAETDAAVAKVDVDANQAVAQQLGARSIPTLVLYADGEAVDRFVGAQDRATLEAAIDEHAA